MNVLAIDVGTSSVRLAIISFQQDGFWEANIVASCKRDIRLFQDGVKFEQDSQEIWEAICYCSHACLAESSVPRESIKSIAFSATCSLVVVDRDDNAAQARTSSKHDVIMWMDHRAIDEAHRVTSSKAKVLNQFGGTCSPEFSLAKLLWLKELDPERFNAARSFFELPDWLVYKCIGGDASSCPRSLCSLTCKWGFDADEHKHCEVLVESLGQDGVERLGSSVVGPGTRSGWLSPQAAEELGLMDDSDLASQDKENFEPRARVAVGTSLIDAHSGMLAMLSVPLEAYGIDLNIETTFCSLAGTSSCHMLLSRQRSFTAGVWGPYKDVVLQGYNLLEAGQSLTGRLIEMTIESHEEGKRRLQSGERMYAIIEGLNLEFERRGASFKQHLHILPTFHGNRSPLANPRLRGGVYGLSAEGPRDLLEYYVATLESIVFELRLIVETLGTKLDTILVSGGLMKNKLFMQVMADILHCRVVKMSLADVDFMVMGSGLVARHAALQMHDSHAGTTTCKSTLEGRPLTESSIRGIKYKQLDIKIYEPNAGMSKYYEKRYRCYREFAELSLKIDQILHSD